MRNAALATALIAALLVIAASGNLLVNLGRANPKLPSAIITFYSPQNNKNYASDFQVLNFSIQIINDYNNGTRQAWYSLDGEENTPVPLVCEVVGSVIGYPWSSFWGLTDLPSMSTGPHYLKVSIEYNFGDFILTGSNTVTFNVESLPNSAATPPEAVPLPFLSMPVEYVNYTITSVNGALWAKIDGTYPIHVLNSDSIYYPLDSLPMVYPTPPGTVNINVTLNEKPIDWTNYTELYPTALHHTAIGEWPMIYCTIKPVTANFTLKIHYEHPLPMVNGSYLFLYDLNIASYLSPQSPTSTAYFKIRTNLSISDLKAYTTETDTVWNTVDCTTSQEGTMQVFSVQIQSEYSKPLKGDLVITLNGEGNPDFPSWVTPILFAATAVGICLSLLVYWKKRKRQTH